MQESTKSPMFYTNIDLLRHRTVPKKLRIVLVGDAHVGKSTLCKALKSNIQQEIATSPTIGAEYTCVTTTNNVTLELWDTAGQERYRALVPLYYRHADIFLLVFDVTERTTFNSIENWITSIQQYKEPRENNLLYDGRNSNNSIVLIANKIDKINDDEYNLFQTNQIDNNEAVMKAQEHGIPLCCTSAIHGLGIDKLKESLEFYAIPISPQSDDQKTTNLKEESGSIISDFFEEGSCNICTI